MSLEQPTDGEVMALRFDEPAAAEELARWCGAEVTSPESDPQSVVLLVPTSVGPLPASVGDWIVRHAEGEFKPYAPEGFAARFTPAEDAAPL